MRWKFILQVCFFSRCALFLLATLYKQREAGIWLWFCNQTHGNLTPFVKWKKQKQGARREMHFYGIESSEVKCYKRLNHKKNFINVVIWVQFNFVPFDHLKLILKYFEMILFNGPFIISLIKLFILYIGSIYNN